MAAPEGSPAPGDDAIAEAHRAIRADESLQFAFEQARAPQEVDPRVSNFLDGVFNAVGEGFAFIAPALQWFFWIVIAGLALYLVFVFANAYLAQRALARQQEAPTPEAAPTPAFAPAPERARALLEEADRLAGAGRFGDAVRVLLHRSIDDIDEIFPAVVRPSMTSREIARVEPLSPEGRAVFSRLAQAVEASLFGGRPVTAEEFAARRRDYAQFALRAS